MATDRLPLVPDDWNVWAFSDSHGLVSGMLMALRAADLIDAEGRWCASPHTALIGCGDYLDRGQDVRGMIELLRRLEVEAAAAGGMVLLARGNHEAMWLHIRGQMHGWIATWLRNGGEATLASYGLDPGVPFDPDSAMGSIDAWSPGVFAWLAGLPEAVRWRDVLFVHGGLPPDRGLEDLGVVTDEHLWIRSAFYASDWDSGELDRYRHAGIERVVFGHTPQHHGAATYHGGRSLCIDTNAVGNRTLPIDAEALFTLVRVGDGPLERADRIVIATGDAPDRAVA